MKASTSNNRPGARGALTLLSLVLCGLVVAGDSNVPISQSPQLTLTAKDYQAYFLALEPDQKRALGAGKNRMEDFVLDFHSDTVLAKKAEQLNLDQDPLIKALLESARRDILVGALMKKVVDDAEIPDFEEVSRERYLAQKEAYRLPEKRKVAQILIKPARECAPAGGEKRKTVEEILAELEAGADFGELARKYSDDRVSGEAGGVIDSWIPENDRKIVPPFLEATFRIPAPGDISPPVRTRFGVHIIKLLEVEPGRIPEYEEVHDQIVAKLQEEYRNSLMEQQRAEAYPDPDKINYSALEALLAE